MEDIELKLIRQGLVTGEQLNLAKQDAARCGKSVWATLVKLGYLSEEDVMIFLSQESGINYVRISDYEIDYEVIHLLREDYCRANSLIPLFKVKDTLFIACSNPLDASLADNLAKTCGCAVELLLAARRAIAHAMDLYWGPEDNSFSLSQFIYKQKALQGLMPWRESERMDLNIPVAVTIEDKSISLNYSSALEGSTRNISKSGTAIGLQVFLFLPKGINVSLEFRPYDSPAIKAKGEIVYSRMEKGQHYLLGILFTDIEELAREELFKLATHS